MARSLTFAWRNIVGNTNYATLKLLPGDPHDIEGWHVEKWVQGVAQVNEAGYAEHVKDKITCLVNSASVADLAAKLREMSSMADYARRGARDASTCAMTYLDYEIDGEPNAKIGFIRNINYKILEPISDGCGYIDKDMTRIQLEIIRQPYWEDFNWDSQAREPAAAASVTIDYRKDAADIPGDAPVRMSMIFFSPLGSGDELGRIWAGIRSGRKGDGTDATKFENIWELEDGTNNAAESGVTDDAATDPNGASPGSGNGKFVKVIPTDLVWDDTWQKAMNIELKDVTAVDYYEDQFGLYKWLLRAKVTAGEWQIQLRFGYLGMDDGDFVENAIVNVDNTSWDYFDQGQRQLPMQDTRGIPFYGVPIAQFASGSYSIQIWARRISGAGHLYLDCFCPIPMDEGYFIAEDIDAEQATTDYLAYVETPFDTTNVLLFTDVNDTIKQMVKDYNASMFAYPPNCGGYLVVVYARKTSSDLTDTIRYNGLYHPRWFALREV